MVIAADRRQARGVFGYIAGLLDGMSMLAQMVESRTKETINLSNRVTIEVHTAMYKSVGPVNCKMGRLPRRTEAILAAFLENVLLPSRRPRLASNRSGRNSVRPNHLSGHNFDHDYDFELPREWRGSGAPHQVDGDLLHTMDVYGLPCVRTELPQLLVIPSSAPHPVHGPRWNPHKESTPDSCRSGCRHRTAPEIR